MRLAARILSGAVLLGLTSCAVARSDSQQRAIHSIITLAKEYPEGQYLFVAGTEYRVTDHLHENGTTATVLSDSSNHLIVNTNPALAKLPIGTRFRFRSSAKPPDEIELIGFDI